MNIRLFLVLVPAWSISSFLLGRLLSLLRFSASSYSGFSASSYSVSFTLTISGLDCCWMLPCRNGLLAQLCLRHSCLGRRIVTVGLLIGGCRLNRLLLLLIVTLGRLSKGWLISSSRSVHLLNNRPFLMPPGDWDR